MIYLMVKSRDGNWLHSSGSTRQYIREQELQSKTHSESSQGKQKARSAGEEEKPHSALRMLEEENFIQTACQPDKPTTIPMS